MKAGAYSIPCLLCLMVVVAIGLLELVRTNALTRGWSYVSIWPVLISCDMYVTYLMMRRRPGGAVQLDPIQVSGVTRAAIIVSVLLLDLGIFGKTRGVEAVTHVFFAADFVRWRLDSSVLTGLAGIVAAVLLFLSCKVEKWDILRCASICLMGLFLFLGLMRSSLPLPGGAVHVLDERARSIEQAP